MTSEKYITFGKLTALISFLIGALIFGLYFFTSDSSQLFVGYGFIAFAGFFNLVVLTLILVKSNSDSINRKKLLKTGGIMLINIPIIFIFIWVAFILMGNMRITFTNATQNKLTDINILGCETEYIAELEPNESKTVWVGITGDCSIRLEYSENGKMKTETVASYVTNSMGQKMKHKIDGKDKDIL
jgi:amino acid transporter